MQVNDVKYIWNNSYIWTAVVDQSEEWSCSKFSNLSNWKEEAWKNQGFNGIRTRDLRDTGAMLYQLCSNNSTNPDWLIQILGATAVCKVLLTYEKSLCKYTFLPVKSICEFLRTTLNHYQNLFSIVPCRSCVFGEFAEAFKSKIGRAQVANFHITGMAEPGGRLGSLSPPPTPPL